MTCLVCDDTQVAPDGKPCWHCVDDITPPPVVHQAMTDRDDPYFIVETEVRHLEER